MATAKTIQTADKTAIKVEQVKMGRIHGLFVFLGFIKRYNSSQQGLSEKVNKKVLKRYFLYNFLRIQESLLPTLFQLISGILIA